MKASQTATANTSAVQTTTTFQYTCIECRRLTRCLKKARKAALTLKMVVQVSARYAQFTSSKKRSCCKISIGLVEPLVAPSTWLSSTFSSRSTDVIPQNIRNVERMRHMQATIRKQSSSCRRFTYRRRRKIRVTVVNTAMPHATPISIFVRLV